MIKITRIQQISDDLYIGQGCARKCYFHPRDKTKCLKIDRPDKKGKQSKIEMKYYNFLYRRNVQLSLIANFYGTEQANMGLAYVYELCMDEQHKVSKPIDFYLKQDKREDIKAIVKGLYDLRQFILSNKIMIHDFNFGNTLYNSNLKSVKVIDGIGNLIL